MELYLQMEHLLAMLFEIRQFPGCLYWFLKLLQCRMALKLQYLMLGFSIYRMKGIIRFSYTQSKELVIFPSGYVPQFSTFVLCSHRPPTFLSNTFFVKVIWWLSADSVARFGCFLKTVTSFSSLSSFELVRILINDVLGRTLDGRNAQFLIVLIFFFFKRKVFLLNQ